MKVTQGILCGLLLASGIGISLYYVPSASARVAQTISEDENSFIDVRTNKDSFEFGKPVLPSDQPQHPPELDNDLPSATFTNEIPTDLANNAEIIVISGYEPGEKNGERIPTRITIDRPGHNVLLVLNSYERVSWQVSTTKNTRIKGIIVSARENKPTVKADRAVNIYQTDLPYAGRLESPDFVALLRELNDVLNIDRVMAYRGSYTLERDYIISQADPENVNLTLAGPSVTAPPIQLPFKLYDQDFSPIQWTLSGPEDGKNQDLITDTTFTVSPDDQALYEIKDDTLHVTDLSTKAVERFDLPSNFPEFSWVSGLAYDSKRNIVSIVSLGGDGQLYRFHAKKKKWIDTRSVNDLDFSSLTYDAAQDRYLGLVKNWSDGFGLIHVSGAGDFVSLQPLTTRLPHYKRFNDLDNEGPSNMQIIVQGQHIGLVQYKGVHRFQTEDKVNAIWYYDEQLKTGMLTYKND